MIRSRKPIACLRCLGVPRVALLRTSAPFISGRIRSRCKVEGYGKPGKYRCFRSRNLSVRLARFATSTKRPPMARTGWSFGRGGLPSAPRSPASSTKQACKDAPLKELWPPSRVAIGSAAHAGSAIENFYRECANGSPGCQGQANCTRQCAPTLSLLAHHRIDYRHREDAGGQREPRVWGQPPGAAGRTCTLSYRGAVLAIGTAVRCGSGTPCDRRSARRTSTPGSFDLKGSKGTRRSRSRPG